MKFPYIVVRDGVWYPAGTEVPVGNTVDVAEDIIPETASDDKQTPKKKRTQRVKKEV